MAGHRSNLSIAAAYEDLSQRMVESGWQVVQEFSNPMAEVPHYRGIRFRKNAVRVNLGFVMDPAKPDEKINIFCHAESVMPIDIPMIDHRKPIKFDSVANRASVPWDGTRADMVELLSKQAPGFGWQLLNADDFVQEKTTVLYISTGGRWVSRRGASNRRALITCRWNASTCRRRNRQRRRKVKRKR